MDKFELFRLYNSYQSYQEAKDEGHLTRWFVVRFLFFILRLIIALLLMPIKLLVIFPIRWLWNFTGREQTGIYHFLKFCLYAPIFIFIYGVILFVIIQMLFGTSATTPVTQ